jgi:predicted aspartyl protease
MKKMGTFRVGCKIESTVDRKKSAAVENLLVDAGAGHTWLPADVLQKIGVKRETKNVVMALARGQQTTRNVGFAIIRSDPFFTVDEVVFAEPGDCLRLGARTLGGFNARIDAKLKKLVAAGPLVAAGNINETV